METKLLFILCIAAVMLLTVVSMWGITAKTGFVAYEKCWETTGPLSTSSETIIKMNGCTVNGSRICCKSGSCPDVEELKCKEMETNG